MNPPEILDVDVTLVDKAISLWHAGELVAIATETVYGLAADATNGEAVARIYALKSRPQFNPLITHVGSIELAKQYGIWNEHAEKLARAFWPGPLTLVLPRTKDCAVSELVSAGGNTLALRMPAHPLTLAALKKFGRGLAAPSANRSGRVSPTTAQHVRDEFGDALKLVLDGGACTVGIESTVVDVSDETPQILRPGSITREMIEKVVSRQSSVVSKNGSRLTTHDSQLKSPGMLESHYAPSIPVRLNATDVKASEALLAFGEPLKGAMKTLNLSESKNLIEAAANLFAHLRALDDARYAAIAVMEIPDDGIGEAINDRLRRAAA